MGLSLQSYNNLLTTCATLWNQVTSSNIPESLGINIQRTFKIIVEQGASLATNTIITNTTTAQLNECKTFLKAQVISMRHAGLCFIVGTGLIIIYLGYELRPVKSQQTSSDKASIADWISLALVLSGVGLLCFSTYKIYNFSTPARALLASIEKPPAFMSKSIKQIETLRDIFLTDVLYKTF